jgi:uncharacterized protein
MKRKMLLILVVIILLFSQISCRRSLDPLDVVSVPENRVIDSANLLTGIQEGNIFDLIQEIEKNSGSQVAVLLVSTLNGRNIESYSLQVAENLRLGRLAYKDGILITVAYADHKARIEVGGGLEKILKDEIANRIIREGMIPKFKQNQVYEGLYSAVDTIGVLINKNKELIGSKP